MIFGIPREIPPFKNTPECRVGFSPMAAKELMPVFNKRAPKLALQVCAFVELTEVSKKAPDLRSVKNPAHGPAPSLV